MLQFPRYFCLQFLLRVRHWDKINELARLKSEHTKDYRISDAVAQRLGKNIPLAGEIFNSTTRRALSYRAQLGRTCIYLTYVNPPPALLTPRKKGEWNISHRDFRSLKRRIAYGVPEKRNFSCRITLRRKEEGGNIEGKSGKKDREKEREGREEEWRERHFTRTGGSRATIDIDISLF